MNHCFHFVIIIGDFEPTIHTSLSRNISLEMQINNFYSYDCYETEVLWELERADGEIEVYIIRNHTYYGRFNTFPDQGISLTEEYEENCFCHYHYFYHYYYWYECTIHQKLTITPTDMRYDGAQITGVVNLPECFNTSNTTVTTTLRIQGVWCMFNINNSNKLMVVF